MNPKVSDYINNSNKWKPEMTLLRGIILECMLTEELKWRVPCFSYQNANVVLICAFKNYCTLSFFKGVLLNDTENILTSPGENSESVRMLKFTSTKEILALQKVIKAYIFEAIELEKSGIKVKRSSNTNLTLADELVAKFNENPALKNAFKKLTPGRQRAYNLYFSAAKQSQTRIDRIEKYVPKILKGVGINDCTCGLSKRKPNCDGSHKQINKLI